MRHVSRIVSLLILAGSTLFAARVDAGDGKIYPGTICKSKNEGGGRPDIGWDGVWYSSDAAIANLSVDAYVTIVCPVIRDNTTSTVAFDSARVDVFNNGSALDCTFSSKAYNGEAYFVSTRSTTALGYTALSFTALTTVANWSTSLECTIPKANLNGDTFIKAITVTEP